MDNERIVGLEGFAAGHGGAAIEVGVSSSAVIAGNRWVGGCDLDSDRSTCDGIRISSAEQAIIDGNTVIARRGTFSADGIDVTSTPLVSVTNNVVWVDGGDGISIGRNSSSGEALVHSNTVVAPAPASGRETNLMAISGYQVDRAPVVLRNNVFACQQSHESQAALREIGDYGDPSVLEANAFHGCGGGAYVDYDRREEPGMGVLRTASEINALGDVTSSANVDMDPAFVGASDAHLGAGSPLIDLGSTVDTPTTDIDGDARPRGAAPDIGADEAG